MNVGENFGFSMYTNNQQFHVINWKSKLLSRPKILTWWDEVEVDFLTSHQEELKFEDQQELDTDMLSEDEGIDQQELPPITSCNLFNLFELDSFADMLTNRIGSYKEL